MKPKHFLSILDFTKAEIVALLKRALVLKREQSNRAYLKNKLLVSLFEKPSLRTRLSFERAIVDLGGSFSYYSMQDVGLGVRESIKDVARVSSRMSHVLCLRVFAHSDLIEFASNSSVPVINALSDREHPCQALADMLTILEHKAGGELSKLKHLKIAYVGDGNNNVTHSLALISALLGVEFSSASPPGYGMARIILKKAREISRKSGSQIRQYTDPRRAVANADIVYTDTWVSMGCEDEQTARIKALKPYQVTASLMEHAKPNVFFMHDLPAYRGNEVAPEVIDGPKSIIYDQAENRLHAQKALLVYLLASR